ncbi:MAG: hypothetical protein F6K04_18920 [Leptolyngbya sp. SIO4C5]|uniref:hypothetical protein n=1 Tax=Sphaerothrix gracilis TaxID=3151835 RepID=UPI0013C0C195|nr:hypothetical protein [Leptolyngbya sp. SIO4C5]
MHQNFLETSPLSVETSAVQPELADVPRAEIARVTVSGSPEAVKAIVHDLHNRRFAEANDWCPPVPTGKVGEVIRVLLKRVWIG